ncbi:MAG: phasin family protein [Chromatiales bacterium]|nr:MAG: phasin family protein [Chromatiales bacterium]
MTDQNRAFEQIADMQRQAFEPMRAFGGYAVHTFENFMRENFAVMGDVVDYTLAQAKMAGQAKDVSDYVDQQISNGRAFSEKMAQHVQQYINLAGTASREATEVAQAEIQKVAKTDSDS